MTTEIRPSEQKRKKRPLVDVKCLELAEHFLDFDFRRSLTDEQLEDAKWGMAEQFQDIGEQAAISLEEQAERQS